MEDKSPRRKTKRIKRISRCVYGVSVGILKELLTLKLFYWYRIEGFWFLLVCFVFVFCHVITFVRYIGVYYTFGLLDCVRYIEVLSHTFYCNFGWAKEYRWLYRELGYIEVCYIEVLVYLKLLRGTASQKFWSSDCLNKYRHPLLRII